VRLTADRLIVAAGERIRAIAVVTVPEVVIDAQGGLPHLRHVLEDVGFRDVTVATEAPTAWGTPAMRRPITSGFEWPVWLAARSVSAASLSRDLSDEIRIVYAWNADDEEDAPELPAYPVFPFAPKRLVGFVEVFGHAYPLFALGGAS